jgi:predicted phage-related endonuclease
LAVYEAKVTGYSQEDNDWLRWGRDMENPVANMYADRSGRLVTDLGATTFQYHPDVPFLAATLDRRVDVKKAEYRPGALEVKNTDVPGFKPETWAADNPDLLYAIVQNQVQMACTGWDWGSIVGKFPFYQIAWFDQERNNEFLDEVYPALEDFWKCVVDKTPPQVESHRDLEVVKRLWPAASGETVALDNETQALVGAWEAAKGWRKHDNETVEAVEAKLRAAIGDATWGALPDGTFLSLKTTKRKGYTRVVEPGEYRTLRRVKSKK